MQYYPRKAIWEITNACNANCIHCGSKSGRRRDNELTEEECLHLCDELKELGCEHVTLMGGEFFLNPHWEKVCERLMSHKINIGPLTNGLLLNTENIQKLKNLGQHVIYVSIDGVGKTHDYMRGVPGLFDKVVANIKAAKEAGLLIGINTAISAVNYRELDDIFEFLSELGVRVWQMQVVENVGWAKENPELDMSVADLYEVARKVAKYRKKNRMEVCVCDNIGLYCYFEPLIRDNPFRGCVGGKYAVGIQADGEIRGCLSIIGCEHAREGNLRERSLKEIWNDPNCFKVYRNKTVDQLTGFCAKCEYKEYCMGGCNGLAWSLTGDFTENPLCLHKYEIEAGLKEPTEEEFES